MEDHHMSHNDDFAKNVTQKLDKLAHAHRNKQRVMQSVLAEITTPSKKLAPVWKVTGFAIAAALAGIVIFPNTMNLATKGHNTQTMINTNTTKLSPQMVDDLEMVMVFGEDSHTHGS